MFAGLLNTLTYAGTIGVNPIPGTASLVTVVGGPEGILLKRVANLQEAINCGGLLLRNSTSQQWMFYVGNTLTKVISSDSLGKVLTWPNVVRDSAHEQIDLSLVEAWRGGHIDQQKDGTEFDDWTCPGYEFKAKMIAAPFFATDVALQAFGVVCSASDGSGVSHPASLDHGTFGDTLPAYVGEGMGYMSTEVPLNETFKSFFERIKPAQVAKIPDNLKEHYTATYEEVMAATSYKELRPTTAVCTYWKSSALWSGAVFSPLDVTAPMGSHAHGDGIRVLDYSAWNTLLQVNSKREFMGPSATSPGYDRYQHPQTRIDFAAKHRYDVRPGEVDNAVTGLADLTYQTRYCAKVRDMVPGVGKVAGLNVGLLRDLHVLKRSKVDEQRFALEPANYASIGALVNDSVVQFNGSLDLSTFDTASPTLIQAALTALPQIVSSESTSIFSRGTLPYMIERFSNAWDEAAMAHAKANS